MPGANAWANRVTLPGNARLGVLRHANDRVDPGSHSERRVLRYVDLSTDNVALHQREHERCAGLHEAAGVDIPLSDSAIKRRDHALIRLLLLKHTYQGLLSGDV